MPISNPCDAWSDLLYDSANRGEIYQHFTDNQAELLDHLSYCTDCQEMVGAIDLTDFGEIGEIDPNNLESMDSAQFARLIRILYKAAQNQTTLDGFGDSGFDTD